MLRTTFIGLSAFYALVMLALGNEAQALIGGGSFIGVSAFIAAQWVADNFILVRVIYQDEDEDDDAQ